MKDEQRKAMFAKMKLNIGPHHPIIIIDPRRKESAYQKPKLREAIPTDDRYKVTQKKRKQLIKAAEEGLRDAEKDYGTARQLTRIPNVRPILKIKTGIAINRAKRWRDFWYTRLMWAKQSYVYTKTERWQHER